MLTLNRLRPPHNARTKARPAKLIRSRNVSSAAQQPAMTLTARRILIGSTLVATGTLFAVYYFDSRSAVHRYFLTPVLRHALDPEMSHKFAVKVLRSGWAPRDVCEDDERLRAHLWGEELSNPLGLAAGFDKNGEAIDSLFDLGFAWVEVGSVTPNAQPGNPKPRVFHLPNNDAMINRYGFPSDGAVSVLTRLKSRLPRVFDEPTPTPSHASLRPNSLLAINLGKNKTSSADSVDDFIKGVKAFAPYADVLVVNVSSPNTPGLRGMQNREVLRNLLDSVTSEAHRYKSIADRKPRVVLKIAPDLDTEALRDIAEAVSSTSGVDGVIVSNTTIQRPSTLLDEAKAETGGLSGGPVKPLALQALRTLRSFLPPSIPLIGCGGIATGEDALDFAKAGASFVQLYTSFGYGGVGTCRRIKDELTDALAKEGKSWKEVVDESVEKLSAKKTVTRDTNTRPQAKEESGISTLVEEALAIKQQLDVLGEKLGEKVQEASQAIEIPSPTM